MIPAQIIVGPYTYRVESDKPFVDSHNAWGHIQYSTQTIRHDPTATPEFARVIVLHEVLHAITHLCGLKSHKAEERFVDGIAPLLIDTLRRNPDLVAYLTAEDGA